MAIILTVDSVLLGVDANRISVRITSVAGSSISITTAVSDFNRVAIELEVGVSAGSVADAINADADASQHIVASGIMDGASAVAAAGIANLSGGSAGAGEGQYYSGEIVVVSSGWIPQYHKARGKPGS